jgi:hypothetical protein
MRPIVDPENGAWEVAQLWTRPTPSASAHGLAPP